MTSKSASYGWWMLAGLALSPDRAVAQSTKKLPLPTVVKATDENGVDMMGGVALFPGASQSIGTKDSGISVSRLVSTFSRAYENYWGDNLSGGLDSHLPPKVPIDSPDKYTYDIKLGYEAYRYNLVSGAYQAYKMSETAKPGASFVRV